MESLDNNEDTIEIKRGFGDDYSRRGNYYTCQFDSDWLYDKCHEQGYGESLEAKGISEADLKYADCQVFLHDDTVTIFIYAKGSMHNAMIKVPKDEAESHAYTIQRPDPIYRTWGPLGD